MDQNRINSDQILDIDLGNSAAKYRFGERAGSVAHRSDGSVDVSLIDIDSTSADGAMPPRRIRLCSVLGDEQTSGFVMNAQRRWGVEAEVARSLESAGGVTSGYREAATLGVDRWLAVLAAYHRAGGATLVVDLGTAVTLDYVNAAGKHLGGYIVPGTHLMSYSLLNDTAEIEFSKGLSESRLEPGCSTKEAVERGALLMLRNLIEGEVERFHELCHHDAQTILCGGGAQTIAPFLRCAFEVVPELVLDGLAVALP